MSKEIFEALKLIEQQSGVPSDVLIEKIKQGIQKAVKKDYPDSENIRIELNIMNSLIGSKNIEADFTALLKRYPEILKCVPTLLAVRQSEIYAQDSEGAFLFDFNRMNYSVEQYMEFMRKTGLLDLIANHLVNNLVDYVLGIETGLDSNGRKNRGGHQMENLVEGFIKQTGAEYYKEMYITDIEKKWGVDLSAISAEGTSTKRWDFVVKTDKTIYVIETIVNDIYNFLNVKIKRA